jgi:hypothetical protein
VDDLMRVVMQDFVTGRQKPEIDMPVVPRHGDLVRSGDKVYRVEEVQHDVSFAEYVATVRVVPA